MVAFDEPAASSGSPEAGADAGTLIGKRYVDASATIEVLCTKAGEGSLSLGDEALAVKDVKQLPASD